MPVLSGNVSIGWPCSHITVFLHALQNIFTNEREDFILEQGLKQGCVQSPKVQIKWIKEKKKKKKILLVSQLIAI